VNWQRWALLFYLEFGSVLIGISGIVVAIRRKDAFLIYEALIRCKT